MQFSVIIPTYQRASTIHLTIESVLAQTFQDFEILVMDDGSTDGTDQVIADFENAKIRYGWESNSGGPARPRNRGIEAANGDWVCFLDADDVWHPKKLETVFEAIQKDPFVEVICHDEKMAFTNQAGNSKHLFHGPVCKNFYKAMLVGGNRLSTSCTCVKRRILDDHEIRFDIMPEMRIVEDYDLWLRLAYVGAKFKFIKKCLAIYLVGEDSISTNSDQLHRNTLSLLEKHCFEIQTFTPHRESLMRLLRLRVKVDLLIEIFGSSKFVFVIRALKLFAIHPIVAIYLFYMVVLKRKYIDA